MTQSDYGPTIAQEEPPDPTSELATETTANVEVRVWQDVAMPAPSTSARGPMAAVDPCLKSNVSMFAPHYILRNSERNKGYALVKLRYPASPIRSILCRGIGIFKNSFPNTVDSICKTMSINSMDCVHMHLRKFCVWPSYRHVIGRQNFFIFVPKQPLNCSRNRRTNPVVIDTIRWYKSTVNPSHPVFLKFKPLNHRAEHPPMIVTFQRPKHPLTSLLGVRGIDNFLVNTQHVKKTLIVFGKRAIAVTTRRNPNEVVAVVLRKQTLRRNVIHSVPRGGSAVDASSAVRKLGHDPSVGHRPLTDNAARGGRCLARAVPPALTADGREHLARDEHERDGDEGRRPSATRKAGQPAGARLVLAGTRSRLRRRTASCAASPAGSARTGRGGAGRPPARRGTSGGMCALGGRIGFGFCGRHRPLRVQHTTPAPAVRPSGPSAPPPPAGGGAAA